MKIYTLNQCTEWEGTDMLGIYTSLDKAKYEKLLYESNHKDELGDYSWLEIRNVVADQPAHEDACINRLGKEVA